MPGRTFRLEPLLRARRRDESLQHARYLRCRFTMEAARRDCDDAGRLLDGARAHALAAPKPDALRAWQAYLGVLGRRLGSARRRLHGVQAVAAAAREDLLCASRARAVLELLRDRQHAADVRADQAAQERERDDFSARRSAAGIS